MGNEIIEELESVISVHEITIDKLKKELEELRGYLKTCYIENGKFNLTKTF